MKILKFPIFLIILLSSATVYTQTTILNVPSTDVISEKKLTVEADFISHFDRRENGGFQTYGIRAIYGVHKKLETGFNFYYTRNGINTPKELQANFKYKIFENEKYGLAVATGSQIIIPLNASAGKRTFGMVYANASKTIRQTHGTRVTGGFYTIVGADSEFGSKKGTLLAVEQPVRGKLSFYTDWYSGKNRFGYSAIGVNYALTKKQYLLVGYNFGNTGRGNNALGVYYGITY